MPAAARMRQGAVTAGPPHAGAGEHVPATPPNNTVMKLNVDGRQVQR
jgi:hypothetical protein